LGDKLAERVRQLVDLVTSTATHPSVNRTLVLTTQMVASL
jgi:hypothetical protein